MTWPYLWFSSTTTTVCAGCGTLAAGAALAVGGGVTLAVALLDGAEDAQPATARASTALAAARTGDVLIRQV
jgi:hypothetical protein